MGNTFDWRSKIHDTIDEFEKMQENPCAEIMASGVEDQTMQPMQSKSQLNNVVKELLHHVVDLFASDDLIYALEDVVTFFEADERCYVVGSEEWTWHQQAQMILEQYESTHVSESYAEKLDEAYIRHCDTLVTDVEGFLGVEDSLYAPNTVLEDTYLPSHGDLTWFPPESEPSLLTLGKYYFEVRMPDFEIETTTLTKPSVEITIPDGWVPFNITFDGNFNWMKKEPEDTTPDGILFSKIED